MVRPARFGFSEAQPNGRQTNPSNQAGPGGDQSGSAPSGKTGRGSSSSVVNPARGNSKPTYSQGSINPYITSTLKDLNSLISELPTDLQDLYQGYVDTSVAEDKDPNALLTDLDTLKDSAKDSVKIAQNEAGKQAQENPNQTIAPNSLDVPALMAEVADASATDSAGAPTDGNGGGSTSGAGGSVGSHASSHTRGSSSGSSVGSGGVASASSKGLPAQRSSGLMPAHSLQVVPGRRLKLHA